MIDAAITWFWNKFTGLGSLVLSALLVVLYRQQKELLRVEHLPEIEISSRSIDGDGVEVVLSNYGDGLAKNVSFQTVVHAPEPEEFEPLITTTPARRLTDNSERTLERSIRPHESQVTFEGTPRFEYKLADNTESLGDFSTAISELYNDDVDSIWFQIYVVVEDQLDGCQMKPLFSRAQQIEEISNQLETRDDRIYLETAYDLGWQSDLSEMPDILIPECRE